MRILLAEDDVSQAQSIKTWLEMDGYNAVTMPFQR